jgi:hypothetical protein
MRVSTPLLSYRIWRDGMWIDPARFLDDIDSYLRWIFSSINHEHTAGGLLIEADGKLWNSHETIDSAENMASWFVAAAKILQGERESFVWAWEECSCYMRRRGFLIEIEERSHWVSYPTVRFPFDEFMSQLPAPGRLLIQLQRVTAGRIQEIEAHAGSRDLPAEVAAWASALPPEQVASPGFTAKWRWEQTREFPLGEQRLAELERDICIIERALGGTGASRPTRQWS